MRFVIPIILIGMTITGFFMFVSPAYTKVNELKVVATSYDEALTNSKALEEQRDKLTKKYSSIDPENLDKLSVLLPDSVDNIRLILEIEKIASPYNMFLKDVKYNTDSQKTITDPTQARLLQTPQAKKDYGDWDLEFSTEGTYLNFVNFLTDLEHNLRIVDVSSVSFSSQVGGVAPNLTSSDIYKFSFKVKTYWLKN